MLASAPSATQRTRDGPVLLAADAGARDFKEAVGAVVARDFAGRTLVASNGVAVLAEEQVGEGVVLVLREWCFGWRRSRTRERLRARAVEQRFLYCHLPYSRYGMRFGDPELCRRQTLSSCWLMMRLEKCRHDRFDLL